MKIKAGLFVCLISISVLNAQPSKTRRVLFIGNSYTYVNDLPGMVAAIARGSHDSLYYDSNCPGGYTFANHFQDQNTISKIAAGNWDFVVLQAQSQEPAFSPAQVNSQTLPFAVKLDSVIKKYNPCAVTVFYETWGRKNGDASNCGFYPPVCTYNGMQARLRQSYQLFADSCRAVVVPAGEAWRLFRSISSQDLYQADESHPSLEGTFLTANVFYQALFQRSAVTGTYNPGVSIATQSIAAYVVRSVLADSLSTWNITKYAAWADFSTIKSAPGNFTFSAQNTMLSHRWYFGDNGQATSASATHQYITPGTYTVSHVNYTGCNRDSVSKTIVVDQATFLNELSDNITISLQPQPAGDNLLIITNGVFSGSRIYNLQGQLLSVSGNKALDLSNLMPGMYLLSVYLQDRIIQERIFKE